MMLMPAAIQMPASTNATEYQRAAPIASHPRAAHRREVRGAEQQDGRKVEEVVDPEAPAADEPVPLAERAADPRVDAALFGIARAPAPSTATASGTKKAIHASTHSVTDGGPVRAPRAIHRIPTTATMFMRTTSRRPSALMNVHVGAFSTCSFSAASDDRQPLAITA